LILNFQTATVITAILGAWATISKYFYEKNRQIYERRLNEVYAPLYGLVIKQEKFREMYLPNVTRQEAPIFTSENKSSKQTLSFNSSGMNVSSEETKEVGFFDRKKFITTLKETNQGLARPRLLELINQYDLLVYLEETMEKGGDQWEKATSEKVIVEYGLTEEIISGYQATINKLGLDNDTTSDIHLIKWYLIIVLLSLAYIVGKLT